MAEDRQEFENLLEKGLEELGLSFSTETKEKLYLFYLKLREFGEPLGLTGLKEPRELIIKHLLDSLTVLPFLPQGPLLDLGTGAGLPGLVIKIAEPGREVWLVDARKKAVSFLTYVAGLLDLGMLKILQAKVGEGDPLPRGYFSVVVSRAVAELSKLWSLSFPLLKKGGILLAMKGPKALQEVENFREKFPDLPLESRSLHLPLGGDKRILVLVEKV